MGLEAEEAEEVQEQEAEEAEVVEVVEVAGGRGGRGFRIPCSHFAPQQLQLVPLPRVHFCTPHRHREADAIAVALVRRLGGNGCMDHHAGGIAGGEGSRRQLAELACSAHVNVLCPWQTGTAG